MIIEKKIPFSDNSFYRGYISNLYLRESCYQCKFNKTPRIADITLADYRCLGDKMKFNLEKDRPLGFTGLFVNNETANDFISKTKLKYEERYFDELASGQPHLSKPAVKHNDSSLFFEELKKLPFNSLSKKYMKMSFKHRMSILARSVFKPKTFYAIGRIY